MAGWNWSEVIIPNYSALGYVQIDLKWPKIALHVCVQVVLFVLRDTKYKYMPDCNCSDLQFPLKFTGICTLD